MTTRDEKLCFKCVFFFSIISCQRKFCWGNCSDVENLCQTFKSFSLFLYSVYFIISGQIFFLLLSEEILLSDRKQFFLQWLGWRFPTKEKKTFIWNGFTSTLCITLCSYCSLCTSWYSKVSKFVCGWLNTWNLYAQFLKEWDIRNDMNMNKNMEYYGRWNKVILS